jgi:hypothetical protein
LQHLAFRNIVKIGRRKWWGINGYAYILTKSNITLCLDQTYHELVPGRHSTIVGFGEDINCKGPGSTRVVFVTTLNLFASSNFILLMMLNFLH